MSEYDTGIIGGGPGGYTAALYAAKLGKTVVLFEENELGGTCLNRGCIPTKAFLHAADLYSELLNSHKIGICADNISFNYQKISEYKNNVIQKLRKSLEFVIKNAGITVVRAHAELINETVIKTFDNEYKCGEIIISTGSKPRELSGLEFDHKFILSSDDILNLEKLPENILIIGSGAIGIEWTRILSSFGVETTVVELAERLVPLADWEVSKRVERMLKMKRIKYFTSTSVKKIENRAVYLSNGEVIKPECVLAAVGRTPVRPESEFPVKYIGDACGEIQLAHYAVHQAKNMILSIPFDKNIVPAVIYGTPEIAWIGEVSKSKENDENYQKIMFPVSALGKAHCDNNIDGFIKILVRDDKIKGGSIISKEASALIQQLAIAMQNNIPVSGLKQVCFAHPTYSEGIYEGIMSL